MEIALGSNRRILHQAEREKRASVRRSVYLREPVSMGRKVGEAAVEFRRPGFGIGPDLYESLLGYTFRKDFPAGHMLRFEDIDHEA